jgi:FkbM family methyltransferase
MDWATDIIRAEVKPGFRCVDVGANTGETACEMIRAGAAWVLCIEPNAAFCQQLVEYLEGCPYRLVQAALADGRMVGEWYTVIDPSNPVNGCLTTSPCGDPVQLSTLDACVGGEHPIHFIKIDVEGMEWRVIEGARCTIEKDRPLVLFETRREFECGRLPTFPRLEQMFLDRDYRLFDWNGNRRPANGVDDWGWNTLAIPVEKAQ